MKGNQPDNTDPQTVIAWDELTRRIDDETLFARIAHLFLEDSGQRLESLSRAIDEGDWESVRFLAHAIKGSAANISARRLMIMARNLECAARTHADDCFAGLYEALRAEYRRVYDLLSDPAWHERYRHHKAAPLPH